MTIVGGQPLRGTVPIAGAKNAALPLMAAALLTDQPLTLTNVPRLRDIGTLRKVLAELGVKSRRTSDSTLRLQTVEAGRYRADEKYVQRMRASFCVLGPLLARQGRAVVPLPGGCVLGQRPVDVHLRALEQMGAEISLAHGQVIARATRLHGAAVSMLSPRGPSVTGTANVLSAAVLARGTTIIQHAAQEPEIVELAALLTTMGARIDGAGSDTIQVCGIDQLHGTRHQLMPDRIEAATYLFAAIVTRGDIVLQEARPEQMQPVIELAEQMGATVTVEPAGLRVTMADRPRAFSTTAQPYPGLPTDVQPLVTVAAALANGESTIADQVFPHRWAQLAELTRMGADIKQGEPGALATGVSALTGASVIGYDLRATAALVLAGLAAKGVTTLHGLHHLERGYQNLPANLQRVGANIRVEKFKQVRDTPPVPADFFEK
jgi:UDP-N-acetylglucosamine 1-carboxyvinyltransferase